MIKIIAMLFTTLVLALTSIQSFAISPGAGQAQIRNNMQELKQNQERMKQMKQNQEQKVQQNKNIKKPQSMQQIRVN